MRRTAALCAVLAVLLSSALHAQLMLGDTNLVTSTARSLTAPMSLASGLRMRSFVARIGGVAFDKTATPAPGLAVGSLALSYNPLAPDGARLMVTVNDNQIAAPIPDWQLIPIARIADTNLSSLVTIFGDMDDQTRAAAVLAKKGRIVNYHPALENTLLGLRILQLDMLVINQDSTDLPAMRTPQGKQYILGTGEAAPNTRAGLLALAAVSGKMPRGYHSYIIGDHGQTIRFTIENGVLRLTGSPYYYFWRDNSDLSEGELEAAWDRTAGRVISEMEAAGAHTTEQGAAAWVRKQIAAVRASDDFADYANVYEAPAAPAANAPLKELFAHLLQLRHRLEITAPIYLKAESDAFSAASNRETLRSINPAVWDTAVATMRYGAFFRYAKQNFPAAWSRFVATIRTVRPQPPVATPTEVYEPVTR